MAEVCALETTAQLKSPAEKFYNLLKTQNHQIPNACSKIHEVEVQEGDWETPGSVKLWKYSLEGKEEVLKERIEVDEANKTVTFVAVEGNIRELYKSYRNIIKVETNGTVKFRVEYEKLNEEVPAPTKHLQFIINMAKEIDENLV